MTAPQATMGERLAWARNQQGLILSQVSERSGLAIGYISQLEKGAKQNPTMRAVDKLAGALGVTKAFIMGEVPTPNFDGSMPSTGHAHEIRRSFVGYLESLPSGERQRITTESVENRFARVVEFLCGELPERFTRVVVAFQLGVSVRGLNDILERNCLVTPMLLKQMSNITGIPESFFATGRFDTAGPSSPDDLNRYLEALLRARQKGLTPGQLLALIEGR